MSGSRQNSSRLVARATWLKIHLYLGLTAGTVLALLGVTGSVLVFSERIDVLLNPQLEVAAAAGSRISPDEAIAAIERRYGKPPLALFTPEDRRGVYRALSHDSSGRTKKIEEILVDASTGKILAGRVRNTFFVSIVHTLHSDLFLGTAGAYLLAAVSVLAILSIVSGLYLWWPRGRAFRKALTFHWHRYAAAMNFEVHRVAGFYLAGVLLLIAVSGLYLVQPGPVSAVVSAVARVTPWPDRLVSQPATPGGTGSARLPIALIDQSVQRHRPGAQITVYSLPASVHDVYEVHFREAAGDSHALSTLWIDQYSGQVLAARQHAALGMGDRLLDLQIRLHNGTLLGPIGEGLVFLSGVTLPALFGTGLYLWWIRRPGKRRENSRPSGNLGAGAGLRS